MLSAEVLATECERRYGERTYTAHRADLLDAIRRAVPAGDIRLGRRCVSLETGGPRPRLRFADGEAVEADVVIGADGIHSLVRAALTEPAAPTYSGWCAFRALGDYTTESWTATATVAELLARADINHLPDGPAQQARDAALAGADALAASAWIYEHDADDPLVTQPSP